jgi:pimeloyl-ACP methyl ester carboxylesterase
MKTIESIQEKGLEQYANDSVKKLFAPESFVTNKEKIAIVKEMIMETSVQSLSRTLFALTRRKETCTSLHKISIPVLILVGKEDQITPPEAARQMQKSIKGSILKIIDHAGHLSNIENSYDFNGQLRKFISSVYKKKTDH